MKNSIKENSRKDVAKLRSDIAELKAKQAKANAEEKVRLQARIDEVHERLHSKLAETEQKMKQRHVVAAAKARTLESKATAKRNEAREAVKARIARAKKSRRQVNEASPAPEGGVA